MRFLINCLTGFYYATMLIVILSFFGIFIAGPHYVVILLMALFICLCVRKEYKDMSKEIEEHLSKVVSEIESFCVPITESGEYTFCFDYDDKYYNITLEYFVDIKEQGEVEFMGDRQKIYDTKEKINVISLECYGDDDCVCDCGFNVDDINEML